MGFIYALTLALRIQKGGLMALGLPCNSHSFMSYAVHQRSAWMMHGNEQQPLVVDGNCLAYRSTLLILVAIARSVQWAVENPSGSKCLLLPIFHKLTYDYAPLIRSTTCRWSGLQYFWSSSKSDSLAWLFSLTSRPWHDLLLSKVDGSIWVMVLQTGAGFWECVPHSG